MLKLFLRTPMTIGYAEDTARKETRVKSFECPPLKEGQPAPDPGLVTNLHSSTSDEAGKPIPVETLRNYDLREGLRLMFTAATAGFGTA